ncbi:hypothetical protein [Salarchaeum sp. JOR-1]|uniref:hypothetical protein n=1 Tax=Salarchaeum sp. JOR-1 TaxID=2599399 RepID=UPI0011983F36|nr:hypothetical protein [Salarchaeum sp. JOR-1]QDX40205.1 hypothetical protein FQU85_04580 [Salarchaeum sp. JOR-1]
MHVREAVEADTDAVSSLLDAPAGVASRLLRERTVSVAVRDETVVGVVAFEVDEDAVHVTRLAGDSDDMERLLDEPIRFAANEGLPVELLVEESDDDVAFAVETKGFENVGAGPRFGGEETIRYRYG